MTIHSVPVDLFNPGHVFASLGLMELAEVLHGEVEAGFDWSEPQARFCIRVADAGVNPVASALEFLAEAEVSALSVEGSGLDTAKWKVACVAAARDEPFPIPLPASPATLPAALRRAGTAITLSSWGDGRRPGVLGSGLDNVKFWAGSGGYPGVALLRDALAAVAGRFESALGDPFSLSVPQSSSFRFDWRRDYIPIDIGFSLNEHGGLTPLGYPLVEVLAAIGLSHARPLREIKLRYRYGLAGRTDPAAPESDALIPPPFVRAALGCAPLPFPSRSFTMRLDWPGQENQARCITTVSEETRS